VAADEATLLDLFAAARLGILITIKREGRPQSSIVTHVWEPATRTVRISLTEGRAKTRNLRRDPRASYQVMTPDLRAYAVGEGMAELSPVASDPGDGTVEALVSYYRQAAGEHPNWDEYRAAMVKEGRLLLSLRFDHIYGYRAGR
jgi:PPOX class probable F420-dependent enzyme